MSFRKQAAMLLICGIMLAIVSCGSKNNAEQAVANTVTQGTTDGSNQSNDQETTEYKATSESEETETMGDAALLMGISKLEVTETEEAGERVIETEETGAETAETTAAETTAAETTAAETAAVETTAVETTEAETEAEEEEEPIPSLYEGVAVTANLTDYINIRSGPGTEYEVVGRMYPKTQATIIDASGEWYHIQSGNVNGWVFAALTVTGSAADTFIENNLTAQAVVMTEALRVRRLPDASSDMIGYAKYGERYNILAKEGDWYLIQMPSGTQGYIYSKYTTIGANLGTAMTMAEATYYERRKELETKAVQVGGYVRGAISYTEEDVLLLAALCRQEVGDDIYVGALAVANCVVNRVLNGYWGSTVSAVIYSPGQFAYVDIGILNRWYGNSGWNCYQAAKDALDGLNNIGGYIWFATACDAYYDKYSSWIDICGNVFYEFIGEKIFA